MKSKKVLRIAVMIVSACVFCYAAWQLIAYALSSIQAANSAKSLSNEAVTVVETKEPTPTPAPSEKPESSPAASPEPTAAPEPPKETAPISVDFSALSAQHPDIVGWLYQPDTVINYPVVRTDNNDYYLDHTIDGKKNACGTLFMDFRDDMESEHPVALIYGHNMKTGIMFGTVDKYREQSYFDAHPILYYITADSAYKLEAAAGVVVDAAHSIFANGTKTQLDALQKLFEKSTFASSIPYSEEDRYVILSTCSYEYDNARYLLICKVTALDK